MFKIYHTFLVQVIIVSCFFRPPWSVDPNPRELTMDLANCTTHGLGLDIGVYGCLDMFNDVYGFMG